MRAGLNARIGRTLPSPLFGVLTGVGVPGPASSANVSTSASTRASTRASIFASTRASTNAQRLRWPGPGGLLIALLLALWPHGVYVVRRLTDGSDEPWGIVALLTVIALLARDRSQLVPPTRTTLLAAATLALLAAVAERTLPDLAAAALAMLALGTLLVGSLQRPAAALIALLLLALPIIASLQFYLGYPLRWLVAQASAGLLTLAGWPSQAEGAAIVHDGITVLVDAPCAGIGMLWIGSYAAALLSYLGAASAGRTLLHAIAAALLVLLANIARSTVLFFPEAGLVDWPAAAHTAVGLVALVAALAALAAFAARRHP